MPMERGRLLYEGKAKRLYLTPEPGLLIQYFKDDATAFNARKRGTVAGKGEANNHISATLFAYLADAGVPTHFVRLLSDREMLVRRVKIIPIEVVVRNVLAGSLASRLGRKEGERLREPVLELYYKNDELGDPMINEAHARALGLASGEDLSTISALALRVNDLLTPYLASRGIVLVDFKLEFGRWQGKIILADEIAPDTCRLWDQSTGERLDKDRFRRDLGRVEEAYAEVRRRICGPAVAC